MEETRCGFLRLGPTYEPHQTRREGLPLSYCRWRVCLDARLGIDPIVPALGVADDIRDMRDHAERFRRLAGVVQDERNRHQLLNLANALEARAAKLE